MTEMMAATAVRKAVSNNDDRWRLDEEILPVLRDLVDVPVRSRRDSRVARNGPSMTQQTTHRVVFDGTSDRVWAVAEALAEAVGTDARELHGTVRVVTFHDD